jgi:DNA-binding transcriptional ArsR family regulator
VTTRREAAAQCVAALDASFFKALAEPVRIELLRLFILQGRLDVGSVAAELPQDRSVVARHLQVLERAKILRSTTEGRHTFYEIDGKGVLAQLESLLQLFRRLSPICCPS